MQFVRWHSVASWSVCVHVHVTHPFLFSSFFHLFSLQHIQLQNANEDLKGINYKMNANNYKKVVPTPPFCTKRPLAGILYCSPSPQLKFEGGSIYEKAIKWAIVWLLLRLAASNLCQTSRMSSSEVRNYAKHGSHGIWYHMLLIWSMKVPKKERIEFSKRHSLLTQPDCKRQELAQIIGQLVPHHNFASLGWDFWRRVPKQLKIVKV